MWLTDFGDNSAVLPICTCYRPVQCPTGCFAIRPEFSLFHIFVLCASTRCGTDRPTTIQLGLVVCNVRLHGKIGQVGDGSSKAHIQDGQAKGDSG
jgi:hypothetical protein